MKLPRSLTTDCLYQYAIGVAISNDRDKGTNYEQTFHLDAEHLTGPLSVWSQPYAATVVFYASN